MGVDILETKFVENMLFLCTDEFMGSEICVSAIICGDVILGVRMSVTASCVGVGCTQAVCVLVTRTAPSQ